MLRSAPVVGVAPSTSTAVVSEGWRLGTYFGVLMRDLQVMLHRAHDGRVLPDVLAAACTMNVVARNAYNTYYIQQELGKGCDVYLNAHGGVKPDGSHHYWLKKLTKVTLPFAADCSKVVLSVSDSMAVSQSGTTLPSGATDTGKSVAILYATDYEVPANDSLMWLLNRLAVPDMYVQRALRPDVPVIHYGSGKNGWDQSFSRLVMTTIWVHEGSSLARDDVRRRLR